MTIKVGINGFGRMGRLTLRAAFDWDGIEFIHVNDPAGDAETFAHLLTFDSVHGRWHHNADAESGGDSIVIDGRKIGFTRNETISETNWSGCDIVIEASGKMKTKAVLHLYDPSIHPIVTAASCTTNCLGPVVKVLHENLGIVHGSMTTIHSVTNTQTILDAAHKDLRRARASGMSLIPTTTGSASAITHLFPELEGKLNGHAIRVPLANASLTDCVFEVKHATTEQAVNKLYKFAADNELKGILGYEERPLVSIDYRTDPRSSIIDALSTMVINGTQLKLYLWYDNEWGYANRTAELMRMVGQPAS